MPKSCQCLKVLQTKNFHCSKTKHVATVVIHSTLHHHHHHTILKKVSDRSKTESMGVSDRREMLHNVGKTEAACHNPLIHKMSVSSLKSTVVQLCPTSNCPQIVCSLSQSCPARTSSYPKSLEVPYT